MKKLKGCIFHCICLILISSCQTTPPILGLHERCTLLGDSGICTDERVFHPPIGCTRWKEKKHTYICPAKRFVGYQATPVSSYRELADDVEEMILQIKGLKIQLRSCDGL